MEEKKAIALVYGALMMSHQCLQDPRPRADYSRFYRGNYKKLSGLKYKNEITEALKGFYQGLPKCTSENQKEYAEGIIKILSYGIDKITKETSQESSKKKS